MFQQTIDEAAAASWEAAQRVLALQTAPLAEADVAADVRTSSVSAFTITSNCCPAGASH